MIDLAINVFRPKGYKAKRGMFDASAFREWRWNMAYLKDADALEEYCNATALRLAQGAARVCAPEKAELPFDLPKREKPTYQNGPRFIGPLPKPTPECVCQWDEDCILVRDADNWNEIRPSFHPHRSRRTADTEEATGPPLTAEEERASAWYVPEWEMNPDWQSWADNKAEWAKHGLREPRKWNDGPRRRAAKVEASCPAPLHYQRFLDREVPGSLVVLDSFDPEKQAEMREAADEYLAWYSSVDVTGDRWDGELARFRSQAEFARSVMLGRRAQLIAAIEQAGHDPRSPSQVKWVKDVIAKKVEWAAFYTRWVQKRDEYGHPTSAYYYPIPTDGLEYEGLTLADGSVWQRNMKRVPLLRESMDRVLTRAYCACLVQLLGSVPPLVDEEEAEAILVLGRFLVAYGEAPDLDLSDELEYASAVL